MFRRVSARRRYLFVLPRFICVLFDPFSLEVFYFAQIIPTFCEGRGGGGTYKFTDIFTCDLVAHYHVRVGGGDASGGGEERKPNTLPLSIECINIKFDSLASSLLPFVFVFLVLVMFGAVRPQTVVFDFRMN